MWLEYGTAAFDEARERGLPVLVLIGAARCPAERVFSHSGNPSRLTRKMGTACCPRSAWIRSALSAMLVFFRLIFLVPR